MRLAPFVTVFLVAGVVGAQVGTYEGSVFPEEDDWLRVGTFDADRSMVDGRLVIDVDLGAWEPLPYGELDAYKRWIPEFEGPRSSWNGAARPMHRGAKSTEWAARPSIR